MKYIAGYLIHKKEDVQGERGLAFNYGLAANGVWITAQNELLSARIPISNCQIRGLVDLQPYLVLRNGKIPANLFYLALETCLLRREKEVYFALTWDNGYHLFLPEQSGEPGQVTYFTMPHTIMELHSHPNMPAMFSFIDDRDEQGFRLSAVIGQLNETPKLAMRVGVYGHFYQVRFAEVFEGDLRGVIETTLDEEEVMSIELQSERKLSENSHNRSWWNRITGLRGTLPFTGR